MTQKIILILLLSFSFVAAYGQKGGNSSDGYKKVEYIGKAKTLIQDIEKYKFTQLVIKKDKVFPAEGYWILLDANNMLHFLKRDMTPPKGQNGSEKIADGIYFNCWGCPNSDQCNPGKDTEGNWTCKDPCNTCVGETLIDNDKYENIQIAMGPL